MLKTGIFFCITALFLMACSGNEVSNSNNNSSNNSVASGGNNANFITNSNANTANSNTNIAAKTDNSPKRISFSKGANWGTSNVILAPGATQLFVVSAKTGQTMDVESSSKEVAINLRKGKAQTTEDFGYLNAELEGNGDFVFEIKNTSKKEVKTSIKVTIEGGSVKSPKTDEIDESDSTIKDDKDVPPPPASNRKGNEN